MLRVSNIAAAMGQKLVGNPNLFVSGVAVKKVIAQRNFSG